MSATSTRTHRRPRLLGACASVLSATLALAGLSVGGAAVADVGTIAHDSLRTGWDRDEPGLSPSAVASSNFGKLFSATVDGQVYAQPLVVGTTVIAATENNAVYGLDSATGAATWTRKLGPAWQASTVGCGDLTPNIGITSTPVYDPATKSVFLLAKTDDGGLRRSRTGTCIRSMWPRGLRSRASPSLSIAPRRTTPPARLTP